MIKDDLRINLDDLSNLSILRDILLYHVVGERLPVSAINEGNLDTLSGAPLEVTREGVDDGFEIDGLRLRDTQQRKVKVHVGNLEAGNGVVHIVNQVFIPEFENIVQIVTTFPDYSILVWNHMMKSRDGIHLFFCFSLFSRSFCGNRISHYFSFPSGPSGGGYGFSGYVVK